MTRKQSHEEVYQEHVTVLGPELGALYNALYNDLVMLHAKWQEFKELFGQSPERVQTLNRTAGYSFFLIQQVYWDDILLHIARLIDPPESVGQPNLTLRRLPKAVTNDALSNEVKLTVDIAVDRAKFARDWRNRFLAHTDLALSLKSGTAQPLTPASIRDVEETLNVFATIMQVINLHYFDSELYFYPVVAGDANNLLFYLEKGLEAIDQRKQKRKRIQNKSHRRLE